MGVSESIAQRIPRATSPSNTSGLAESDLQLLEPSGEAVGSAFEVSSTTSVKVAFGDVSVIDDEEAVRLASTKDRDSSPWLKEWEEPEGQTATWSSTEKTHTFAQTPETVIEPDSDSATNYQSDSPTDSYSLVSAEAQREAA